MAVVCAVLVSGLVGGVAIESYRGSLRDLAVECERARALEEQDRPLRARATARDRVARELAGGRLSLLEAAAAFRDLELTPPTFSGEDCRAFDPTASSDDERLCRSVIRVARGILAEEAGPEEAARVAATLEAELNEHLARGGLTLREPRTPSPCPGP
jgi:hypothetical protein